VYSGLVGSAIAVPMWTHRCFRNLPALGATPAAWSPAWAAGGWFVPVANLFVPYLVVRELWRCSHFEGSAQPAVVALWWAACIAPLVLLLLSYAALLVSSTAAVLLALASNLATIPGGVLLIAIVRIVSARQRARYAQLTAL
jgi:hypothetical protein